MPSRIYSGSCTGCANLLAMQAQYEAIIRDIIERVAFNDGDYEQAQILMDDYL
jgi:hypothetical protein